MDEDLNLYPEESNPARTMDDKETETAKQYLEALGELEKARKGANEEEISGGKQREREAWEKVRHLMPEGFCR